MIKTFAFVVGTLLATSAATEPMKMTITHAVLETSPVSEKQIGCLAEAIYWEGRNQSIKGMVAIGQVIMNRVESPSFPNTVCRVAHQGPRDGSPIRLNRCQFSYFCDGKDDDFPINNVIREIEAADNATLVAELIAFGNAPDPTQGSTYYHADYVSPNWADSFEMVGQIDDHLFYVATN